MTRGSARRQTAILFVVQFFTWVGMFTLWVFTLPLIAMMEVERPIRWVGICFALYVTLAAVIALGLPMVYARIGMARTHGLALLCGAAGMGAMGSVRQSGELLLCFAAVAVGWASISSTPYTLVSDAVSDGRYARTMGIFNFSIVIPQVAVALSLGALVDHVAPASAIMAGGASMGFAGVLTLLLL